MFYLELILGVLIFFLLQSRKYLKPRSFSYRVFYRSNRFHFVWSLIVALFIGLIGWIAPESINTILSEFGYNTGGALSGITAGYFIGGLSRGISNTTKRNKKKYNGPA